jgi:Zn-dependent protease/CBS domain-containing protein
MQTDIKLGKVWGIPIGINNSWFIIFALLTWSLATGLFPDAFPHESGLIYLLLAVFTSVLFFGSVLLHELGHAYMALRSKINVRGITLFIFGGIAQLEQDSRTSGEEFRIAIAGPLVSLALAALFGLMGWISDGTYLGVLASWLAGVNLSLALFNMIPGYPLDGGRVLKAAVWQFTGDGRRATRIAATSGRWVAYGFFALGGWIMLTGGLLNGLWLILIGWFLQNAARMTEAQSQVEQTLGGVRVADVMARTWAGISAYTPLRYVVDSVALRTGERFFLVRDDERFEGLLTLRDIASVPQQHWSRTLAQEIMIPWRDVVHVDADADLLEALRQMERAQVEQAPVVEAEQVVGVLTRESVLRYLRLRGELRM